MWSSQKKAKEDLYIRILLWAHDKQESGFTIEEIRPAFSLSQEEDTWMRRIFLTTSDQDRKFFEHIRNDETSTPNRHLYSLNEKGITAAINYKALAHAEKSSQNAIWFAGFSILLTALGLILQWQQTRLSEIQTEPILEQKYRSERQLYDFCKEPGNWDISEGGSTPNSTCKATYTELKKKFGTYPPAEGQPLPSSKG